MKNQMSRTMIFLVTFLFTLECLGQTAISNKLHISKDGRHIEKADGTPFFWLGDTAWELFHRLTREEANLYLKNRAKIGFNVIQAVVLAEFDGLKTPNAYGENPLINNDPTRPNEKYFEHVDYVVDKAASLGMYIGILPTWGDKFNKRWGIGPEIFTPENAYQYGLFLGKRYRNAPVIWILGGDRIPEEPEDFEIIRAMARGLAEGDAGNHLFTYHPMGGRSSAEFFQHDKWLDINMLQSGHGAWDFRNFDMISKTYSMTPTKPVLDGEPRYEDHPVNWNPENGWFASFDVRQAGYWAMLAGACGHTYGCHDVWQMLDNGRTPVTHARTPWYEAIDFPGAYEMGIMKRFFESLPWDQLKPMGVVRDDGDGQRGSEVLAAKTDDDSLVIAYSPYGRNFGMNLPELEGQKMHQRWFNPRLGNYLDVRSITFEKRMTFDPPADIERGNDWVLVLEKMP